MQRVSEWLRRVWYLLNRRRFDAALKEEMAAHRAAMHDSSKFGNVLRLQEESRDVWGLRALDALTRDVRFAVRMLLRSRGFSTMVVASLALGLALMAVTVSTVNAYLLSAMPYASADRLFHVMYAPPGPWEPRGISALDWTTVSDVVEFPITASGDTFYLGDGDYAQAARGLRAARGFIDGLGVRVVAGRTLNQSDFAAESDAVALIGHSLWRDRYGSDPAIVGRVVRTEAESGQGAVESFRVVGVLAPDFYFGRDSSAVVDLLVPLSARVRTYMVRLQPGVPQALAEQRITAAARLVATDLPTEWTGVRLEGVRERYVAGLRPVLTGVTVASGVVLLIVCTNVAVLTLLRAMRRRKELAVRAALGSGRWQVARMLVVEAALLCGTATVLGLALTHVALRLLAPVIERQLGRPAPGGAPALAIDWTVLLVVGGLSLLVALSLSFLPLLTPWQRRLGDALRRDRVSSTDSPATRRLRSGLMALEVAGTLVLLVVGGLMVRSAVSMVRTDLGFDPQQLVRTRIVLRGADYQGAAAFHEFYRRFADRLTSAIDAPVAFSNWPPFAELPEQSVETEGRSGAGDTAGSMQVGAGYFGVVGTRLRSGRDFTAAEVADDAPVAVVSASLAARLWPDGTATGRQIRLVGHTVDGRAPGAWRTVVGVADDVRQVYGSTDSGEVYLPLAISSAGRYGSFYVRSSLESQALLGHMRAIATDIDAHAVINEPRSVLDENHQLAGAMFLSTMLAGFASIAAFIAGLGMYGVTAYAVQQRQREIAIRMAVGAAQRAVLRLFLRESGVVLAVGVAIGVMVVAAVSSVLANLVYGVPAFDAITIAVAAALLGVIGLLASWWPARRASLTNPMIVLKDS